MKKWIKVCLTILCVLVVLDLVAQLYGLRFNPLAVDKAVLCSYDGESEKMYQTELTRGEIWKLAMLYNLAFPCDQDGVGCPPDCDRLEIHFAVGMEIVLHTYKDNSKQIIMNPDGHVFSNDPLWDYIQELLVRYDLPAW